MPTSALSSRSRTIYGVESQYEDERPAFPSIGVGWSRKTYRPKEMVYRQGDRADAVYYVEAGTIQLTTISEQGKVGITGVLQSGQFFGDDCLCEQVARSGSASARAPSTIVRVEKGAMKRALVEQPEIAQSFVNSLVARRIEIEEDLTSHLFDTSERRLARLLIRLGHLDRSENTVATLPRMSQEVLASCVGTTRSRVSVFMCKFRKLGFIDDDDGLKVYASLFEVIDAE